MHENRIELERIIDSIFEQNMIIKTIKMDNTQIDFSYDELVEHYILFEQTKIIFENITLNYKGIEKDLENYLFFKFDSIKDITRVTYLLIRSIINITFMRDYAIKEIDLNNKLNNKAYLGLMKYFE